MWREKKREKTVQVAVKSGKRRTSYMQLLLALSKGKWWPRRAGKTRTGCVPPAASSPWPGALLLLPQPPCVPSMRCLWLDGPGCPRTAGHTAHLPWHPREPVCWPKWFSSSWHVAMGRKLISGGGTGGETGGTREVRSPLGNLQSRVQPGPG